MAARPGLKSFRTLFVFSALLPLAVCLTCAALALAEQLWLPQLASAQSQYVSRVCVSVRLRGSFRAATWWGTAYNPRTGTARKPYFESNVACALSPWLPVLPVQGVMETSD